MTIRFTTDELNRRVLALFRQYHPTPDRRLTKERLAMGTYGYYDDAVDRKIRDAVTELVLDGQPICADSGAPGYYFASTYEEAQVCIAELRSRSAVYERKVQGILRGLVGRRQPVGEATQMRLGV
jgi:hypothetical protein